jgi:predicted RNase H-related nuclease YkuK (DUF458 family)
MKNDRWFSGDHKQITLDEIILDIKQHASKKGKIYIGSDSFVQKQNCVFCCAIVLHGAEGQSGGRYYYNRFLSNKTNYPTMTARLTHEVEKSIQIGMAIGEECPNVKVELHLDINSDKKMVSSKIADSMTGWVKAVGFDYKLKPYSWASSTIADMHTK